MAISDVIGKVFSSQFQLGVNQVTPIIAISQDRSAEIVASGDGLEIPVGVSASSVADYPAVGTDVTYSDPTVNKVTLSVNKSKYIAMKLEDTDNQEMAFDLLMAASQDAGGKFGSVIAGDFRTAIAAATGARAFPATQKATVAFAANAPTLAEKKNLHSALLKAIAFYRSKGYAQRPVILLHRSHWEILMEYITVDLGYAVGGISERAFVDATLSAVYGMDVMADFGAAVNATSSNEAKSHVLVSQRTLAHAMSLRSLERLRSQGRFATLWRSLNRYGVAVQEVASLYEIFTDVA